MVVILLVIALVIIFLLAVLNLALYIRVTRPDREQKAEEKIQAAMDTADNEARRSREMDEGFDNLMTFEANLGRGRTSGGGL